MGWAAEPGLPFTEDFSDTVDAQTVVTFPDPNLEAAIRDAINKPTGEIYDTDLVGLTSLTAV